MSFNNPDVHPEFPLLHQPYACTHSRMISDSVSEEEQADGKVRCLECGAIIPDPHIKREGNKT